MKVTQNKNLYQITWAPYIFPINCYVWEDKNELFVIDMGVKSFVSEIEKISRKLKKPVSKLLLTHAHADHVSGVPLFHQKFPKTEIGISQRDLRLIRGDFTLLPTESQNKIRGSFSKNIIHIDFTFKNKDILSTLEVIESSGHTPGSVSFFDTSSKTLIAGDAFQTRGGIAVSGTLKIFFPFPSLATWNSKVALTSAKKLRKLNPTLLAVGHDILLSDPIEQIEKAIRAAERK
ncbi:MBL fold metallo-hydrolase [Liquorilactobacillus mali]